MTLALPRRLRRIRSITLFEVVDIVDAQADESVGVAGDGEGLDQLGEVVEGVVDVADLGSRGEAELGERLEVAPELRVVEDRGVAADVASCLESVDPALGGGGGEVDEPADLAGGSSAVLDEEVEDPPVRSSRLSRSRVGTERS